MSQSQSSTIHNAFMNRPVDSHSAAFLLKLDFFLRMQQSITAGGAS